MPKNFACSFMRWMWAALLAGSWICAYGASAAPFTDRLSRRGTSGHIAVHAGGKHLPENAEVSFRRTREEAVDRRVKSGLEKRRGAKGRGHAKGHNGTVRNAQPKVLAMYDIAIKAGGKKWQPAANEPVQVTVELDEPVAVSAKSELGVVHMADDGTVEELAAGKYGFTYNAEKTAVTAFWFSASGFSVYSIVDNAGELVTPRRFYHFYGHPTTVNGHSSTLPYIYHDESNDVVNVQIVKDGDTLKEPPIPADIVDEDGVVISMFEGWYVVSNHVRSASAAESKLDSTNEYFNFVWPVGATDMRMTFTNAVAVTESVDWDYYVVPLYEHARFLQFNENAKAEAAQGAGARIIRRKLVAINDETGEAVLKVSDVEAALKNSLDEYFCGWEYKDTDGQFKQLLVYSELGQPQDQYITVDDALFEANGGSVIPLYPYYVSAHFLHFDSNAGGSHAKYVGSLFVRSSSNFSTVETSGDRKGYNFTGWRAGFKDEATKEVTFGDMVTDANGNFIPNKTITNPQTGAVAFYTDAQGNIRMNEDVTLYGTWAANSDSTYRVIIWQQRVTDSKDATDAEKKYYYVTHYTSPVVPSTTQISESLIKSFSGTAASGTNPNNSNLTTISGASNLTGEDFTGFHYGRWECKDATVAPDASTVINVYYDKTLITFTFYLYRNRTWVVDQVMTGLHGQRLEANGYTWDADHWWYSSKGSGGTPSGTRTTILDAFLPPNDKNASSEDFYGKAASSANKTVNFYKESLTGSWELANTVKTSGTGSFTITDKYNGFTAYQYKKDNGTTWSSVGTQASNGDYSSQSFNSTLDIRFQRNKYELIYKYDDDTGDHILRDTGKVVPYEKPLAEYEIAYTNLDWSGCDITNRTFSGWYEDASLTVPFDFDGTMPVGKKIIYAKWSPLQHKVIIDPNGGELHGNDSTWFYVDPDKNETIKEYHPTRDYRLDMHNGTYYYHHDLWDPLGDKHVTDTNSPSFIPGISRKAYYTTNILEATSNEVSNPENRYTYDPGAYAFMGWYEVLADGTLSVDPFSFGEPPTRNVTLRAIWRRLGVYTLKYESVDPDMLLPTETIFDPRHHDSGNVEDGYVADAETTLAKAPTNYDKNKWIWEGWQAIDTYNNNMPLTTVRSPGDIYRVKASHADVNNVIHFRAVFKNIEDNTSRHIPPVTDLILDSNDNAGLSASATAPARAGSGLYTDGSSVSVGGLNQGVWFAGQQNNFSVNLADYTASFAHNNGYFLLGWDTLRDCGTMVPKYYANETIGLDKTSSDENILYAVWEPQIYIEFVNDTGAALNDVKLYIPGWTEGEVFRVNSVQDTYLRSPFTAFQNGEATFNMAAGETICLVLPDGADKDFAVMGTCSYTEGNKLVVTRIQPQIEGEAAIPDDVHSVYPGEDYMVAGTMKVSPTPVQVRFTKTTYPTTTTVPVRYFLHDKSGTVTEITQYNAAYWKSQNYQTSLTVGSSVSDIAGMLRTDTTSQSVHELLTDSVRTTYGHTTIGIGSASAVITTDHATLHANEYRAITQEDASGGPYFRFYHEELDWSRYSQIWNGYDDPAIYVVFYKRTPVHVTIGKNVVGTEADKSRTFDFTANITQHSTNLEYTVTTTYRQTREISITAWSEPSNSDWNTAAAKVAWSNPTGTQTNTSNATASSDQTPDLFESRDPEQISLADSARHPITIYYDSSDDMIGTPVLSESTQYGSVSSSGLIRKTYTRTQTKTTTQTVTYRITYQYEVATIQEAETNLFTLTGIDGGGDSCKGAVNLPARTYTISSLGAQDAKGFFTYQSLDTAIFTNTRKTGSVTVSKTVVEGDDGDTFPFTLTLGETVVDKDHYASNCLPAGVHLGPYGKVFSFTLADGGSVTLTNLPAGASYTVAEGGHQKYVATVPANASGAIAAGETIAVNFVNTRKTDLTVALKDLEVPFSGDEQYGHEISTVTGTGSAIDAAGYTVTGLKAGHVLTVDHYIVPHGMTVGSYTGHVENVRFTVRNASDDSDATGEYLFTVTPGVLTIVPTPIIVTITGNTTNVVYNGEEQSVQGYTYEVTHALTGEIITNDNVYVAIAPDYQTAWGKDVGTYYMAITPKNVGWIVPEGMSVSNIVVALNGSLVITPASVTVTADNKVKILGRSDPTLTATVTGLFGDDTVEYAVSRAAGETSGTYAITAAGEASQGNYTVTYVPGTFTIQELNLVQRATGSGKAVDDDVPITDDLIEALGFDSQSELAATDVAEAMNQEDPNGLYRWENIVLGTDTNQVLLSTAVDSSAGAVSIAISRNEGMGKMEDLGYLVLQDLRRYTNNVWNRIAGPSTNATPTFSIQMTDASGNSLHAAGYYRVFTLLVPKSDLSITNELPSTNIVGVLEVDSSLRNTMTAVPWNALANDPADPQNITVAGYVAPAQLAPGDAIVALNSNGVYEKWTLNEPTRGASTPKWKAAAGTVVTKGGSMGEVSVTPPPEERELDRGNAVWVSRENTSKPYFLVGQYNGAPVQVTIAGSDSVTSKGSTMITNPTLEPIGVNDFAWGSNPSDDDVIQIPNGSSSPIALLYRSGAWGYSSKKRNPTTGRYEKVWKTDFPIAPGTGFWYYRTGPAFNVTINVDEVK